MRVAQITHIKRLGKHFDECDWLTLQPGETIPADWEELAVKQRVILLPADAKVEAAIPAVKPKKAKKK